MIFLIIFVLNPFFINPIQSIKLYIKKIKIDIISLIQFNRLINKHKKHTHIYKITKSA